MTDRFAVNNGPARETRAGPAVMYSVPGKVKVASELGAGSSFTVSLPLTIPRGG